MKFEDTNGSSLISVIRSMVGPAKYFQKIQVTVSQFFSCQDDCRINNSRPTNNRRVSVLELKARIALFEDVWSWIQAVRNLTLQIFDQLWLSTII